MHTESPDSLAEVLYNIIYNIIKNSKDYKESGSNTEYQKIAIKEFFTLNGFYKKFWIMLAELSANVDSSHKFFTSEILTIEKTDTLNYNFKSENKHRQELYSLLLSHDIYISPETIKIVDENSTEVNQICIKVDRYKRREEHEVSLYNSFLENVISDLKNSVDVRYDWFQGELTCREKITYCFRSIDPCSNQIAESTHLFASEIEYFYVTNEKLLYYRQSFHTFQDFVMEIQKIVGEKQQSKLK